MDTLTSMTTIARLGLQAAGVVAGAMVGPAPAAAASAPTFASIFADHAVLQRGRPVPVWGRAEPGAAVTVRIAGQTAAARADRQGRWRVRLPSLVAGGPYRLSVASGGTTTTIDDVAVGDVFLCGGQSNMEFPARLSTGAWSGFPDAANADLRFVTIAQDSAAAPREDFKAPIVWRVASPASVGEASAVCYYMARALQHTQKVPIGFIASDWGGTTIQSWISAQALRTIGTYRAGLDAVALLARDPARANAEEARRQEAWWDAHDPHAAAQRGWIAQDYDDGAWPTMVPDGRWKESGISALADFDGVAWFRTTVTLSAAQASAASALQLGPIERYDSAWINGVRVGGGSIGWVWRNYAIPPGTMKAGRNVIVLRVLSGDNGGGLTGPPALRGVRLGSGALVPLDRPWRYRTGMRATGLSIAAAPWDVPTSLSTLYNGMIAPLAGYGLKLAAWYQGEANVGAEREYDTLLPLLMRDWRGTFEQPELPFVVAQLSAFGDVASVPVNSAWAALRDVQAKVVQSDPHAGLAVTIDVGDRTDVHPTQKTVVGDRLAGAARIVAYGEAGVPSGPEATRVERRGDDLVIRFRYAEGGLRTYSAGVAIGFEACAATCRFVAGTVADDTIILPGANRPDVVRVRYAWSDAPYVNLYSAADLPAVPFELTIQ
jgi:hypothetical protein